MIAVNKVKVMLHCPKCAHEWLASEYVTDFGMECVYCHKNIVPVFMREFGGKK